MNAGDVDGMKRKIKGLCMFWLGDLDPKQPPKPPEARGRSGA